MALTFLRTALFKNIARSDKIRVTSAFDQPETLNSFAVLVPAGLGITLVRFSLSLSLCLYSLKRVYLEYNAICLVISIDSIISFFCYVLHFLHFVFCFYILYFIVLFLVALRILYSILCV